MEELFIETQKGNMPIEEREIEKLNLKMGTLSPFTRSRIVGKNGEYPILTAEKEEKSDNLGLHKHEDGTVEIEDGVLFTTSEMIDLSQGVDSSTET